MKKICCAILVIIFIFSGCSENKNNAIPQASSKSINKILLAELKDQNISIYSEKTDQYGSFIDLLLNIKGKSKSMHWTNINSPSFYPALFYKDINGDGKNELIIVLTTAEGTGVYIQQIHVLDPDNFSEFKVESPLDFIKKNVEAKVLSNGVQITMNNSTIFIDKTKIVSDPKQWFSDVSYSNHIKFNIENNSLIADVGVQVSPSAYVGKIVAEYHYVDGTYTITKITFKPQVD